MWGHGAEPAENYCYENYNMLGTANGNCGQVNKYKYGEGMEFKKCSSRYCLNIFLLHSKYFCCSDVMCGTLHCQGGMEKPTQTTAGQRVISTQVETRAGPDIEYDDVTI